MAKANKKKTAEEVQQTQPESTSEAKLDTRTLVGDIRDFILDRLKHDKENKPWAKMTEEEQSNAIEAVTGAAESLVRNAVDLVATQGFNSAKAEIDAWKVKGKAVVLTLKAIASEQNVLALLNAGGTFVTLTFANDDQFDQDRSECSADPDQPELSIEDEGDDTDH